MSIYLEASSSILGQALFFIISKEKGLDGITIADIDIPVFVAFTHKTLGSGI